MLRTAFDLRRAARILAGAVLGVGAAAGASPAQGTADPTAIIANEIQVSRDRAELKLELADGRKVELAIRSGYDVWVDGKRLGTAARGEELRRSWRELLNRAMDSPADELPHLLIAWESPDDELGRALDRALEAALTGQAPAAPAAVAPAATIGGDDWSDSVAKLNARIAELEKKLRDRADAATQTTRHVRRRDVGWPSPLHHIGHGIAGVLSTLAVYAVLVGIGFVVVFFGRKYLEGVADTARHETVRSGLVGLAASFLLLPGFIIGAIALAISIVGIPLLLVWIPLFPVAVVLAAIFGYLGVAHAAGESLAERRFYGGEWFKRANSYYYVLTGLALLLGLFIAANVVEMGGPWLGFIRGMLTFLAVVLTWAAFTIGFGAVLLSRAGTKPRVTPPPTEPDVDIREIFEEGSHV